MQRKYMLPPFYRAYIPNAEAYTTAHRLIISGSRLAFPPFYLRSIAYVSLIYRLFTFIFLTHYG